MTLILTDQPYSNGAEPLYRWLGDFAARVLVPGGSLICFTGKSTVPREIDDELSGDPSNCRRQGGTGPSRILPRPGHPSI